MKIIKEKKSLKETIPFMALLVALNVLLISIATYLPISSYLICLFLPLISTIFCLNTKIRFYPIYIICTLGLGMASTFQDFSFVLLYLLPSLIEGCIFALCIRKRLDGTLAYFYSTLVLFICFCATIPLVDFVYSTNTINNLLSIFALDKITSISWFVLMFIYLTSAIEMFVIYMVTEGELSKLGYKIKITKEASLQLIVLVFICATCEIMFWIFKFYNLAFLLLSISIVCAILLSIQLFRKNITVINVMIFTLIAVVWIVYVALIVIFGSLISLLIFIVFPLSISIICLSFYIYEKINTRREIKK